MNFYLGVVQVNCFTIFLHWGDLFQSDNGLTCPDKGYWSARDIFTILAHCGVSLEILLLRHAGTTPAFGRTFLQNFL